MNKAILLGRLAKDPELRYSKAATPLAVSRYALAVSRRFKRDGEPDADFFNCIAFGKSAEFSANYFKKGMLVAICGHIQNRQWEDDKGQKRYATEIIVDEQNFAESKAAFESRSGGANEQAHEVMGDISDDDLPF